MKLSNPNYTKNPSKKQTPHESPLRQRMREGKRYWSTWPGIFSRLLSPITGYCPIRMDKSHSNTRTPKPINGKR